jgi:hypothetical protein
MESKTRQNAEFLFFNRFSINESLNPENLQERHSPQEYRLPCFGAAWTRLPYGAVSDKNHKPISPGIIGVAGIATDTTRSRNRTAFVKHFS